VGGRRGEGASGGGPGAARRQHRGNRGTPRTFYLEVMSNRGRISHELAARGRSPPRDGAARRRCPAWPIARPHVHHCDEARAARPRAATPAMERPPRASPAVGGGRATTLAPLFSSPRCLRARRLPRRAGGTPGRAGGTPVAFRAVAAPGRGVGGRRGKGGRPDRRGAPSVVGGDAASGPHVAITRITPRRRVRRARWPLLPVRERVARRGVRAGRPCSVRVAKQPEARADHHPTDPRNAPAARAHPQR